MRFLILLSSLILLLVGSVASLSITADEDPLFILTHQAVVEATRAAFTPEFYGMSDDCAVNVGAPWCDEPTFTPEAIANENTVQQGQTSQDQYKRDYEAFLSRIRAISYALSSQYQMPAEMLGVAE